jgi:Fe2+ transport system protein FeoA
MGLLAGAPIAIVYEDPSPGVIVVELTGNVVTKQSTDW